MNIWTAKGTNKTDRCTFLYVFHKGLAPVLHRVQRLLLRRFLLSFVLFGTVYKNPFPLVDKGSVFLYPAY